MHLRVQIDQFGLYTAMHLPQKRSSPWDQLHNLWAPV